MKNTLILDLDSGFSATRNQDPTYNNEYKHQGGSLRTLPFTRLSNWFS